MFRDWHVFAVEDTGIGMSPEQLARLFQRFMQADESTTRKFGGTGLGLALTHAFAKLLGGDVTVTSSEGQGTCFCLRIPTDVSVHQSTIDSSQPEVTTVGEKDLVLVIDDEIAQRELVTRFLRKQSFAVRTAPDGRSGLELARRLRPRVILLDIMMPDTDGWSVLKALKADPTTSKIPVVIVSFVAEPKLGAALGAADTVLKPVDWVKLKGLLDRFRDAGNAVLIVDDDADTRRRLRTALEKDGWAVREAGDGAEALDEIGRAPPHLVLLDLTMPIMDGFAFLHRLRATPGAADVPVIVLSARDVTSAERGRLTEARRILRKDETSLTALSAELRAIRAGSHPSPDA